MAISASFEWEVRPLNGSDNNGGGFKKGATGTDFSQQNSAQYSFADLVVDATVNTKVTSASHNFVATDVGNLLHVTAGTGWTQGFYEIVSVAANAATLDRSPAVVNTTGGSFSVGGALATIPKADGGASSGNVIWVKAETAILLSASITVTNIGASASSTFPAVIGYTTTRGDGGKVTIKANADTLIPLFKLNAAAIWGMNLIIDGNGHASIQGMISTGIACVFSNCDVKNCSTGGGIQMNGDRSSCTRCTVSGQSSGSSFIMAGIAGVVSYCVASANTANSVSDFESSTSNGCSFVFCISANATGTTHHGFRTFAAQNTTHVLHCVAYNCTGDGFHIQLNQQSGQIWMNNVAYLCGAFGFNITTSLPTDAALYYMADYNAYGANTSGNLSTFPAGAHDVTLTGDPFTNGAGLDFSLNNTAGAGAALRSAGFPGALTTGGTGFADIGTLRHQDPAGATTTYVISPNITRVLVASEGDL